MKKKILLVCSCLSIFLLGTIVLDKTIVNYNLIQADRITEARDFNELEKVSDLIIKATVLPGKENILDMTDKGRVYFGYTHTKIQINDVYYGNVSKDDIINITEEYYITDSTIGKSINTQGNYMPAKEGKKYIFFLKKYDNSTRYKDMYYPIELEKGKYLINDKTKDISSLNTLLNKDLEIGPKDSTEYKEWFKKVKEKYDEKK